MKRDHSALLASIVFSAIAGAAIMPGFREAVGYVSIVYAVIYFNEWWDPR